MPTRTADELQVIHTSREFSVRLGSGGLFEYNFIAYGLFNRPKLMQHAIPNEDPGAGGFALRSGVVAVSGRAKIARLNGIPGRRCGLEI